MDSSRPSTPQSLLKLKLGTGQNYKWKYGTPGHSTDSKLSEKMTAVSHRSDDEYEQQIDNFKEEKKEQELVEIRKKLSKEEEKNYIFQHFFKKLEKIMYSEHSNLLQDGDIKDYEKLQVHLEDMVKRVEKGTQYNKLAAVPVIYKKNNTVTTMTVTRKGNKKN